MAQTVRDRNAVAKRGEELYAQSIRAKVETEANIGKMVIIDVATGDYEVDERGHEFAQRLYARHPDAELYGIRIRYRVAAAMGGVMERAK